MLTRHFHSKPASTSTCLDRALLIHDNNMGKGVIITIKRSSSALAMRLLFYWTTNRCYSAISWLIKSTTILSGKLRRLTVLISMSVASTPTEQRHITTAWRHLYREFLRIDPWWESGRRYVMVPRLHSLAGRHDRSNVPLWVLARWSTTGPSCSEGNP